MCVVCWIQTQCSFVVFFHLCQCKRFIFPIVRCVEICVHSVRSVLVCVQTKLWQILCSISVCVQIWPEVKEPSRNGLKVPAPHEPFLICLTICFLKKWISLSRIYQNWIVWLLCWFGWLKFWIGSGTIAQIPGIKCPILLLLTQCNLNSQDLLSAVYLGPMNRPCQVAKCSCHELVVNLCKSLAWFLGGSGC